MFGNKKKITRFVFQIVLHLCTYCFTKHGYYKHSAYFHIKFKVYTQREFC